MPLHTYSDIEDLSIGLAGWISNLANICISKNKRFTFALSGGNTPRKLYETLAKDPFVNGISWEHVHLFWGDERLVPFHHKDNNASMAFESLINKINIPAGNVHRIETDLEPSSSVTAYEQVLKSYFNDHESSFDLVLLGMGSDGHTLSVFEKDKKYEDQNVIHVSTKNPQRISITPRIVNRANHIAFMITGKDKASVLKEVIEGNEIKYPAQLIKPVYGSIDWFIDEAAASLL